MTDEIRHILLGLGVVLVVLAASCALRAQEPDSAYVKQVLRLQFSEFCSVVGPPPLKLAEAINNAIAQDPATWLPIAAWWNRIKAHYDAKARCGDA